MRGVTHAARTGARRASRPSLAASRPWTPAPLARQSAAVAPAAHDFARVSISAPPSHSAPIQRVRNYGERVPLLGGRVRNYGTMAPAVPLGVLMAQQQQQQQQAAIAQAQQQQQQQLQAIALPQQQPQQLAQAVIAQPQPHQQQQLAQAVIAQAQPQQQQPQQQQQALAAIVHAQQQPQQQQQQLAQALIAQQQPQAQQQQQQPLAQAIAQQHQPQAQQQQLAQAVIAQAHQQPQQQQQAVIAQAHQQPQQQQQAVIAQAQQNPLLQPLLPGPGNIQQAQQHGNAQQPSRWGQNALDFVTANTPGPITGASGLVSNAVSWAAGPSNSPTGMAANVGLGSNVATGLADVTGIVSDLHTAYSMGTDRLGRGLRANARGHVDQSAAEAEDRSAVKRMGVNTLQNVADVGLNQGPTAANTVLTATGHAAPAVLGTMAAGAGMGVNALVAARSAYRGYRAGTHESNLNTLLSGNQITDPAVRAAAEHHRDQMSSRKKKSWLGAAGATLGAVGGGLLLGGLLGASMLTPIGWGLAAAGGAVAAGLGLYKFGRWAYKKWKGIGSTRDQHAQALHAAATSQANDPQSVATRNQAHQVLAARGITPQQVQGPEGVGLLKRKAESW